MKKLLGILVLGLLLNGNVYAAKKNLYLKCPETVQKVRSDTINLFEVGSVLGTNYVHLKSNLIIKIHFNYLNMIGSKDKPFSVFFETVRAKKNEMGFSATDKIDEDTFKFSEIFNFIEIEDTYAFTRTSYLWNAKSKELGDENEFDYDSSGRCEKIDKKEYKKLLK